MSPWFGLGLHLDPSVWVRSLASFSAFLSQCFFPGPWHLPCAALLPLMSSLHIHCLALPISAHLESQCKELPKRYLSSSVVFCILPTLNFTSFLQNLALPGSIPEAGSSCQAILAILPVSLFSQHLPSSSGVSNSTPHSCLQLHGQTSQILTLSCFSGHIDKSFPCRAGTEVVCSW